jgi:hypothetical protein
LPDSWIALLQLSLLFAAGADANTEATIDTTTAKRARRVQLGRYIGIVNCYGDPVLDQNGCLSIHAGKVKKAPTQKADIRLSCLCNDYRTPLQ